MTWPYHGGELEAQTLAGGGARGGAIRDRMPAQHREFFEALPFVVVASVDRGGPVASVWTGAPGFVRAPDAQTLRIATALDPTGGFAPRPTGGAGRVPTPQIFASLDPGDPATPAFVVGAPLGLLGIDLATRRRNRANGVIAAVDAAELVVAVRQSFGNCPRYIWPREVEPVARRPSPAERWDGLDREAASAIARADTFFVATSSHVEESAGGVDISHRGGPPGFIHLDGNVLTIPDYPGNRYFNTLGNLVSEPRAALLFIDFSRGDILHVQGAVEIVWDGPEVRGFDGAERLWRVHVERGWRRRDALALRWSPASADDVQRHA